MYKSIQRGIKYMPESRRLSPMRPRSLITLFVILDVVWGECAVSRLRVVSPRGRVVYRRCLAA
jgi:hypothetical protein